MQTQYLYNLEFDENGMLTHYENNYTAGSIVNFSFDLFYDDLNRLERIDVSTAGGDEYFPDGDDYRFHLRRPWKIHLYASICLLSQMRGTAICGSISGCLA